MDHSLADLSKSVSTVNEGQTDSARNFTACLSPRMYRTSSDFDKHLSRTMRTTQQ